MRRIHGYITIGILVSLLALSGAWYVVSPTVQNSIHAEAVPDTVEEEEPLYDGNHVVVNLETMTLELRNGTTTLETLPVISKGKPGSYYETIGGAYANDYKLPNHFSSIGLVYMPWSVHVFGNFFIHGIPYYPDGTDVSSAYSGGCVRLSNADAQRVYEFVQKGTPIVITENWENDFVPTATATPTITSLEMTRLMAATISLEVLTQDNEITDTDGVNITTRRELLPRLILEGDDTVSARFSDALGMSLFVDYMNQKARALGLTNTTFTNTGIGATTTEEDLERFMAHIADYKTYLTKLSPTR